MNLGFLICEMGTILPHGTMVRIREIMNVKQYRAGQVVSSQQYCSHYYALMTKHSSPIKEIPAMLTLV